MTGLWCSRFLNAFGYLFLAWGARFDRRACSQEGHRLVNSGLYGSAWCRCGRRFES